LLCRSTALAILSQRVLHNLLVLRTPEYQTNPRLGQPRANSVIRNRLSAPAKRN
jgi:hypothetical protein